MNIVQIKDIHVKVDIVAKLLHTAMIMMVFSDLKENQLTEEIIQ
jgi:hypothetical protein